MKVKICGMRDLEEAQAALDAGADLLGFNFYPRSKRFISAESAAEITTALRKQAFTATLVGVFVNAAPEAVADILDRCRLDLAQLHGNEPPASLSALANRSFKAIRPVSVAEASLEADCYGLLGVEGGPHLLVDAYNPEAFGGVGKAGDWSLAAPLTEHYKLLLAGGLTPENVAQAVQIVQPWGVDVASGVEAPSGRKDPARMAAFVQAARQAAREAKAPADG